MIWIFRDIHPAERVSLAASHRVPLKWISYFCPEKNRNANLLLMMMMAMQFLDVQFSMDLCKVERRRMWVNGEDVHKNGDGVGQSKNKRKKNRNWRAVVAAFERSIAIDLAMVCACLHAACSMPQRQQQSSVEWCARARFSPAISFKMYLHGWIIYTKTLFRK